MGIIATTLGVICQPIRMPVSGGHKAKLVEEFSDEYPNMSNLPNGIILFGDDPGDSIRIEEPRIQITTSTEDIDIDEKIDRIYRVRGILEKESNSGAGVRIVYRGGDDDKPVHVSYIAERFLSSRAESLVPRGGATQKGWGVRSVWEDGPFAIDLKIETLIVDPSKCHFEISVNRRDEPIEKDQIREVYEQALKQLRRVRLVLDQEE